MVIGGKLMRNRMTMLMLTTMTLMMMMMMMMTSMAMMTMMTRSLWWLANQFWRFTDNHPTAYQCTWRSMIADARIAPMTMWSFYADNSDDNDLIVRENYCKFYDVVAKLQGNSCKIGNTRLLGTSKNQNHQLCEICHFCLIFTLQQYIVAQKLIRQPYCSFNQHFVACQRKFSVPRRRRQNIQRIWPGKSVHSAQIKCKRHHLMLKSISRSIYVLFFSFSSGTCSIKLCPEEIKS